MMNVTLQCSCGGQKIIDTVSDDGATTREGIPTYALSEAEFVTRCYCETCGAMFHPQSVGVDRYTTPTRINPQ